jgi:flagellar hook-basal body complex protein FliE
MAIVGVTAPYAGTGIGVGPELQATAPAQKESAFAKEVKTFVANVDQSQKTSEALSEQFAQGQQNDIHGTMIAASQASISLYFLGSVRNRIIDAYREVMRMGS